MTAIIYKKGNILDCIEPYLAHGCNAQGKYNSGLAKQIREVYPDVYQSYMRGNMTLGTINATYSYKANKTFFNCITQEYYGRDKTIRYIDYNAIEECIKKISQFIYNVKSNTLTNGQFNINDHVALPKIGCGLGGGDWYIISKIIEDNSIFFQPIVYEL